MKPSMLARFAPKSSPTGWSHLRLILFSLAFLTNPRGYPHATSASSPSSLPVVDHPNRWGTHSVASPPHYRRRTWQATADRALILTSQAVIGLRLSKSPPASGVLTAAVGLWASSSHFIFADEKVMLPSQGCTRYR